MKLFLKKLLVCILIFIMLFNFFAKPVQATDLETSLNQVSEVIIGASDGLIGSLTYLWRIPVWAITVAIMGLMTGMAGAFGFSDPYGNKPGNDIDIKLLTGIS